MTQPVRPRRLLRQVPAVAGDYWNHNVAFHRRIVRAAAREGSPIRFMAPRLGLFVEAEPEHGRLSVPEVSAGPERDAPGTRVR